MLISSLVIFPPFCLHFMPPCKGTSAMILASQRSLGDDSRISWCDSTNSCHELKRSMLIWEAVVLSWVSTTRRLTRRLFNLAPCGTNYGMEWSHLRVSALLTETFRFRILSTKPQGIDQKAANTPNLTTFYITSFPSKIHPSKWYPQENVWTCILHHWATGNVEVDVR